VVIGVIALLIGLLLPSLGKSRDTARTLKCLVNTKQMGQAAISYAQDFKEEIWPVAWRQSWPRGPQLPNQDPGSPPSDVALWAMINTNGVRKPGFLFQYVSDAHEVVSCPVNKRRRDDGAVQWNLWGVDLGVQFDYTMLDEAEGTRLSTTTNFAYIPPGNGAVAQYRINWFDQMTRMRSVPIFFEESTTWYNGIFRDGRFGNKDQLTTRHEKGGHIAYIDGSSELFKAPNDGVEKVENLGRDWAARHLYATNSATTSFWYAVSDSEGRTAPLGAAAYGWCNQPR